MEWTGWVEEESRYSINSIIRVGKIPTGKGEAIRITKWNEEAEAQSVFLEFEI